MTWLRKQNVLTNRFSERHIGIFIRALVILNVDQLLCIYIGYKVFVPALCSLTLCALRRFLCRLFALVFNVTAVTKQYAARYYHSAKHWKSFVKKLLGLAWGLAKSRRHFFEENNGFWTNRFQLDLIVNVWSNN